VAIKGAKELRTSEPPFPLETAVYTQSCVHTSLVLWFMAPCDFDSMFQCVVASAACSCGTSIRNACCCGCEVSGIVRLAGFERVSVVFSVGGCDVSRRNAAMRNAD
jgi:hypothetical protein